MKKHVAKGLAKVTRKGVSMSVTGGVTNVQNEVTKKALQSASQTVPKRHVAEDLTKGSQRMDVRPCH